MYGSPTIFVGNYILSLQRLSDEVQEDTLCITFGDKTFEVVVSKDLEEMKVRFAEVDILSNFCTTKHNQLKELKIASQWSLGQPIMKANMNGKDVIVQVCSFLCMYNDTV